MCFFSCRKRLVVFLNDKCFFILYKGSHFLSFDKIFVVKPLFYLFHCVKISTFVTDKIISLNNKYPFNE